MKLNWKYLNREDRVAIIRIGAAKKMSASQIAAEVEGATKGSVIGLADRNGIKLQGARGGARQAAEKEKGRQKPVGEKTKKKPQPESPAIVHPSDGSTNWLILSGTEKAAYVRALVEKGLSSGQIAATVTNATRQSIKGAAKRYGIKLIGNSTEARRARSTGRLFKRAEVHSAKPVWAEMEPAARSAFLIKKGALGKHHGQIAAMIEGASEDAVRLFAKRRGIVLPKKPYAPPFGKVNILDIGHGQCRAPAWPDKPKRPMRSPDDWVFCAKPTVANSSYCAACHSKFLVKPDRPQRYDRRHMSVGYQR